MNAFARKNQFDEREQDWLVQKFGLLQLQRLDAIQAETPFLLVDQEDKRRLSWQGGLQMQTVHLQCAKKGASGFYYWASEFCS